MNLTFKKTNSIVIHFLKKKILGIGLGFADNLFEEEIYKLINIYISLLILTTPFVILLFSLLAPDFNFTFNIILFFILIVSYFPLFYKLRFNNYVKTFYILIFAIRIFYNSSSYGAESGMEIYYLPYLFAIIFLFDLKKDSKYIIFLFSTITLFFVINRVTNFSLFNDHNYTSYQQKNLKKIAVIYSLFFMIVNIYFIYRKDMIMKSMIMNKNEAVKKPNRDNSKLELKELQEFILHSKKSNDGFMTKFNLLFPDFVNQLTSVSPNLIASELEVCAMLKLNFSTKEIALSTNSTIAGINRKKNRIRKKIDIPSSEDLNVWFVKM